MLLMVEDSLLGIAQREIHAAQRILIVTHIRPDGDAIGSLLGLGLSLQAVGKEVQMVMEDNIPKNLRHLPGSQQVKSQPQGRFDLTIVVDCSDLQRVGKVLDGFSIPDWNIDHHPTNDNFARHNWVESDAVATAAILAKNLPHLALPITEDVATCLLSGILTDTLGFRTSNVTPQTLRLAADLVEKGCDLADLYSRALNRRSFEMARYWGAGLSTLQRDGRMAWATLSLADRQAVGYPGRDDAELINLLSTIDDYDIVLIFVEQTNGKVKISWRARPGLDVSRIALQFGGGGHQAAAGAEVVGNLAEVQQQILQATRILFDIN
jgi:phosphoesterase RecJ-like protein